jgi:hypothetical protein
MMQREERMSENAGWYAANANSVYPLSVRATTVADQGTDNAKTLPNDMIADAAIFVMSGHATGFYFSGVTADSGFATVMISLADADVLTITESNVIPNKIYEMESLVDGVKGFLVFGDGVLHRKWSGSFTFADGAIERRCIKRTSLRRPIPGIQNHETSELIAGDRNVILKGRSGITVNVTDVDDAVSPAPQGTAFTNRLLQIGLEPDYESNITRQHLYAPYPAAESPNVPDPKPIRTLQGVKPDCHGRITLRFGHQLTLNPLEAVDSKISGIFISSLYTSADVCGEKRKLADDEGILPNETVEESEPENPDEEEKERNPDWPVVCPFTTASELEEQTDIDIMRETYRVWLGSASFSDDTVDMSDKNTAYSGINFVTFPQAGAECCNVGFTANWKSELEHANYNVIACLRVAPGMSAFYKAGGTGGPTPSYYIHTSGKLQSIRTLRMYGAAVNWSGLGGKSGVLRLMQFHRGFWEPLAETPVEAAFNLEQKYRLQLMVTGGGFQSTLDAGTQIAGLDVPFSSLDGGDATLKYSIHGWGLTGAMSYYSAVELSEIEQWV